MRLKEFFGKNTWRSKAISRSKEINSLNKKNKELIISRDKAKEKITRLRVEQNELKKENIRLENELKKS